MALSSPEQVTISCKNHKCNFSIRVTVILGPEAEIHFVEKRDEEAIAVHHEVTGRSSICGGHSEYAITMTRQSADLVVHGDRETGWMVENLS